MLLRNRNLSHNVADQVSWRLVQSWDSPKRRNFNITEGSKSVKEGNLSYFNISALREVLSAKVTVTVRAAFGSESMPLSAA